MPLLLPQPKFRELDEFGLNPLVGGQVEVYQAGTSTPVATFQDSTGTAANPWPVILDSQGRADIWIAEGAAVKVVLKDASGVTQYTVDNVTGVGSGSGTAPPATASEWLVQPETPTFISATSYSIPGDVRAEHHQGRRVRAQVSAGLTYHTISAPPTFATGTTTVTVTNDSTPLDAGLSVIALGILSADNPSASVDCIAGLGSITSIATGDIIMHASSSARAGFVWCDGSTYDGTNATYTALWNAIGTTYGGTGQDNFAVPNLNGRSPMGFGQGNTAEGGGLGTTRSLGDMLGAETHTLTNPQLPAAIGTPNTTQVDAGVAATVLADGAGASALQNTGGGQSHPIESPAAVVGFMIKL